VTTGGEPAAYIVEKHLARFLEGRDPSEVEKIWDQMYFSTQYYGRKGLVVNAISGVDLALWDLLGRCVRSRSSPCWAGRFATS
jgi:L-rhamnonate dehydratase